MFIAQGIQILVGFYMANQLIGLKQQADGNTNTSIELLQKISLKLEKLSNIEENLGDLKKLQDIEMNLKNFDKLSKSLSAIESSMTDMKDDKSNLNNFNDLKDAFQELANNMKKKASSQSLVPISTKNKQEGKPQFSRPKKECPDDCSGNGKCETKYGSAKCDCEPGFDGEACEKKIKSCPTRVDLKLSVEEQKNSKEKLVCSGNGECNEDDHTCKCSEFWTGHACHIQLTKTVTFKYDKKATVSMSQYNGWWNGMNSIWEQGTFDFFHKHLKPTTTYIGFGEWIGPTILFASNYAKFCYGLEPDPLAYRELERNVILNDELNEKIYIENFCISDKEEVLEMAGVGQSGSGLNKGETAEYFNQYKGQWKTFKVNCLPLYDYLKKNDAFSNDMFIKIDTEGAESYIFPTLTWMLDMEVKPTLHLSMHQPFTKASKETREKFVEILSAYKTVNGMKGSDFKDQHLCVGCEIMAVDY